MKVRLDFTDTARRSKPVFVDMESIPRVGEFLVSGTYGTCAVLKVVYTPEAAEQGVILVIGPSEK